MPSSFDVTANVNLNSRNLNASAKKIELALGRITGQASEFQKSLDASTARVFAFGATTAVLNGVNQAFKKLVSTTIEVQKRLVEINSIFQANEKVFNQFRNAIFQVAKETGQAFNTVSEGAAELARQGLSAEETAKRLKASLVLTRISGLDAEKSVKALTAAINGFASAGLSANQIVNKLVAVDTAFAVSAQDLAEAFSRAGSTAEDAGVSFDQLLGLVTAVEQKTARGGAVIGNAFKSIFTRLSRGDTIESLKELGVQIDATQNGIQKLSALSAALENISDPTVASQIKELAGGVFQINVVSAALKDLSSETSIFAGAAKVASQATNEAFSKNAELNKTIAAQINALIAGLTSLAERIGSITFGPLLENLLGLTTKFTEFLDKALDPEKGNMFIKGLFKTIGTFLSGPAVVIFTTAFIKIFALVAKFAKDGLKSVFAIGSESSKIKNIEAGIVGLLQKDKSLRQIITSTTASQAQKEQAIINAIKAENNLLRQQAALVQSIAVAARAKGVASFSGATGQFKGKKGFASGFQQEEAIAMGLGASGGVKAHFGKGTIGGRRFIMNNQEMEIPNFAGGRDSAVIPMYTRGFKPKATLPDGRLMNPRNTQLKDRPDITTRQEAIDAGYSAHAATSRFGKQTSAEKSASKRKKVLAGQAGTLTLNAVNVGLLAAKRGDSIPKRPFTSIDTLSPASIAGVGRLVGKKNVGQVKKIEMKNLRSAAIQDSKPNFDKDFRPQITKSFADPLFNFSKKMVKDAFQGNDRSAVTGKLKKSSSARLFSKATEGGIFESALKMMLAGTKSSKAFSEQPSETAPFDFEESGPASPSFLNKFFAKKPQITRADAKREANPHAARSFISKILRDEQALAQQKKLARFQGKRVKGFAAGHIPRYAKGKKPKEELDEKSGVSSGGAFGALIGVDLLLSTFGVGIDETTGEMNKLGKAINVAIIGLTSLAGLAALRDVAGLVKGIPAASAKVAGVAGAIGGGVKAVGGKLGLVGAGKGLKELAVGQRRTKGGLRVQMGKTAQGPLPANIFGQNTSEKSQEFMRERMLKKGKGGVRRGILKRGATGMLRSAAMTAGSKFALAKMLGPASMPFVGAELGGMLGNFIGGKIDASRVNLGKDENLAGAKESDQRALQSIMRETGGSGGVGRLKGTSALANAQANFIKDLEQARQATKNGTVSILDRTLAENRFKESVQKAVEKQTKLNNEIEKLAPQLRTARGAVRNLKNSLKFSASEGVRQSALASDRSGIMSGLNLAGGPNARAVAARVGVGAATSQAGQSLSALRALQAEASITDPNSDRGKELQKELLDAGAKFRQDVISGAVGFKNNITALNKSMTEKLKEERALVTQRGASNLGMIERFSGTVGSVAGQKDFEKLQKAIEESSGGQDTRNIISRALSDPKFQNAAQIRGLDLKEMMMKIFNQGSGIQGLAGRRVEEATAGIGGQFDSETEKMLKGMAGTDFDEQSKELSGEIADLSNAIAENKQGLSNFLASFNTDTAKGVVNLVETISTDLNNSVQGVTKVSEATKQIDKVNEGVVGLATETAGLIAKTSNSIKTMIGKVAALEEKIANLNLEKKGGGLQSPENPAPVQQ